MNNIKSLVPGTPKGWTVAGVSTLFLITAIAGIFGSTNAAIAALIVGAACLLVVALSWYLITFFLRRSRQRRQRQFDAGIAAREGIDDRRREWQGWVSELEKNGIDRYELPFYLLVGEPQSGKSVLLQNSDLRFLFGQSRLSGIGGTRGCDWWFTEEAVILDLAGRLFTHEGGASDEAEWDAFLDLLNDFRPLDPANGIMLVIPCDVLLGDSPEDCAHKASKSREALLSLTRKLEAKLPIYVILTKADKIFGFAETVHRLSLEQRHQMFGWSRSADRLEEPFDTGELRVAWDGIVDRSDSLRNQMLATARLPEALNEVDRLLGFPEELRGLYGPLETYLNRIFLGSNLVEQLYFRGLYLTSGLQSGAPIAKAFLDILDRPGEADGRDLEKLFVRQQAYFIKDLIRDRVFSERGLVKPTSTRVERAKKKSWLGYGVAASIALFSLVWGVFEIRSNHEKSGQAIYAAAIDAAESLTPAAIQERRSQQVDPFEIPSLLSVLEDIETARDRAPTAMQRVLVDRRPGLAALYETIYDTKYRFELQKRASEELKRRTRDYRLDDGARPADHAALLEQAEAAIVLSQGISDVASARKVATVLQAANEAERRSLVERVERAHEVRGEDFEPDAGRASVTNAAEMAARRLQEIWPATLDPADPVCIGGTIGFCLGWRELADFDEEIIKLAQESKLTGKANSDAYRRIERASRAIANMDEFLDETADPSAATVMEFQQPDHPLAVLAAELDAVTAMGASEGTEEWNARKKRIQRWLTEKGLGPRERAESVIAEKLATVKKTYLDRDKLEYVTSDAWLGRNACADPTELPGHMKGAVDYIKSDDDLISSIARIKLLLGCDQILEHYPDWAALNSLLCEAAEDGVASATIESWVQTQKIIADLLEAADYAAAEHKLSAAEALRERLEQLGVEGLETVRDIFATDEILASDEVNVDALRLIVRTGALISDAEALGSQAIADHLAGVRAALEEKWDKLEGAWQSDGGEPAAPIIAEDASDHFVSVKLAGVDVGSKDWNRKTRARLGQRLEAYTSKIHASIEEKVDALDPLDLAAAIARVTGIPQPEEPPLLGQSGFGPLKDWVSGIHDELNVPKSTDSRLNTYYEQSSETGAWEAYQRSSRGGTMRMEQFGPSALLKYVGGFRGSTSKKDEEALSEEDLAKEYFEPRNPILVPSEDSESFSRGIYFDYCEALRMSFDRAVVRELRSDYLNDFEQRIVEENFDELREFWHDPASLTGRERAAADPVDAFFTDDGKFLALLQRYRVTEYSDRDFRVKPDELDQVATQHDQDLWKIDHFLGLMLLYVREAEDLTDLSRVMLADFPLDQVDGFEMSLIASIEPGGFEDTWNHWDSFRSPLFTAGAATSIQGSLSPADIIETSPVKGWNFRGEREFLLEWQGRAGSGPSGWQSCRFRSSLVPLQLFWSDDEAKWRPSGYTPQRASAEVDFYVTQDRRTPFKLTVKPAPPRLPLLEPSDLTAR